MNTNAARGLVNVTFAGNTHQIRYTLGALRELREALGYESTKVLFESSETWGIDEIPRLLVIGLKRGSWKDASIEEIEELITMSELEGILKSIGEAFNAANSGETKTSALVKPNPTRMPATPVSTPPTPN